MERWRRPACEIAALGPAAVVVALVLLVGPVEAGAHGKPRAALVASGLSPAGERWVVRAVRQPGHYIGFASSVRGQPDAGGVTSLPARGLRARCRALLDVTDYESGWDELAGPADRSVVWVDVELADGRHVGTAPRLARSQATHPWLRNFRWVALTLPRGAVPVRARAFDARGRVVSRLNSDRGLFSCQPARGTG